MITIEQLLRHRSGLFNFTNAPEYLQWMEQPKSREALLELFVKNGTTFEPGEKFEYSNTNYVLLSFIAETIDGKSFAEILKTRIVVPLALQNIYIGGKIDPARNEAKSYTRSNTWVPATETDAFRTHQRIIRRSHKWPIRPLTFHKTLSTSKIPPSSIFNLQASPQ